MTQSLPAVRLPARLAAVAAHIPPGQPFADIGTDHALLPLALVASGHTPRAVASDAHPGPAAFAAQQVAEAGLAGRVDVRHGDGLRVLRPGEVRGAVIAGMGGGTMRRILSDRPDLALGLDWLLLQPVQGAGPLRRWLGASGYTLADEDLVQEDGRFYPILWVLPGPAPLGASGAGAADPADPLPDLGPILWQKRHPLLPALTRQEIGAARRMLSKLGAARTDAGRRRAAELAERLRRLEELIACW